MLCRSFLTVFGLIFIPVLTVEALQCYKCGCITGLTSNNCTDYVNKNCAIQYVENNFCYFMITRNDIELGHTPNTVLQLLNSSHHIRVIERISYNSISSNWNSGEVVSITYGCDWNLCNSPKLLQLLPNSFDYVANETILNNLLIPASGETLSSCLHCSLCTDDSSALDGCEHQNCSGSCFLEDDIHDPNVNGPGCSIAIRAGCSPAAETTSVQISGYYYIDAKVSDITEIDIFCNKDNCNSYNAATTIKDGITYTANIADALYFRPVPGLTTPPTTVAGFIACYVCSCRHALGNDFCSSFNCTIEYQNESYCEISRDFKEFNFEYEEINLGHIPKSNLKHSHYIIATEELILYRNVTYAFPQIDSITYVCDWDQCNDPRIVSKLSTSFQFTLSASSVANLVQGPGNPTCLDCTICSNNSQAVNNCTTATCPGNGHCRIIDYIDDPQFDDCEYAFNAGCEAGVTESSIIITATYDIDNGKLEIDEFDLFCSADRCNSPLVVNQLKDALNENILLDSIFIDRPVTPQTTTPQSTPPPTTTPQPTTPQPTTPQPTTPQSTTPQPTTPAPTTTPPPSVTTTPSQATPVFSVHIISLLCFNVFSLFAYFFV